MKKCLFYLMLVLALVFYSVFVIYYINHFKNSKTSSTSAGLSFELSECQDKQGIVNYLKNIIKSASWEGDKLVVKTIVELNCCPQKVTGDYKIDGNKIVLSLNQFFGDSACMCDCDYEATYKIFGIEKKDYEINLQQFDKINLFASGVIEDECDNNVNYGCYRDLAIKKYQNQQPEKVKEEDQFIFNNPEDKILSEQNPKFLEYFKIDDNTIYNPEQYSIYEFSYDKRFKLISILASNSSWPEGKSGGFIYSGDSMKDVMQNYIIKFEMSHGKDPLFKAIKEKLGLDLTYVSPDGGMINFNQGDKIYEYSFNGLNLKDDKLNFFWKKKSPKPADLDLETFKYQKDIVDKLYSVIEKNNLADTSLNSLTFVNINEEETSASFRAKSNFSDNDNKVYATIHGREVLIENPQEHNYAIDLKSWEIIKQ